MRTISRSRYHGVATRVMRKLQTHHTNLSRIESQRLSTGPDVALSGVTEIAMLLAVPVVIVAALVALVTHKFGQKSSDL